MFITGVNVENPSDKLNSGILSASLLDLHLPANKP